MFDAYSLAAPVLHRLDPERAHDLTLRAMQFGLAPRWAPADGALLRTRLWGLEFPTPLGLAAGFDKDALVPRQILAMGFGFVEVGTVTPRPQPGNPRPRLFRLGEDAAVINRMGFNNAGAERMRARLAGLPDLGRPLGINIGANKDSPDRLADYRGAMAVLAGLADYVVINVSSPNTPGLRELQQRPQLLALTGTVREAAGAAGAPPILVKIAPDFEDEALADVTAALLEAGVQGIVVGNTTVAQRDGLVSRWRHEQGGLSGRPLFQLSTERLRQVYRLTGGRLPIVGVGGVDSADSAYAKIRNGASLVQLYTALVFHGPALVRQITEGLALRLQRDGFRSVAEAVGVDAGREG